MSAGGAFLGCVAGLMLGGEAQGAVPTHVILSFTAGGFIYISLVNIVPGLVESNDGCRAAVGQVVAMSVGVLLMVQVLKCAACKGRHPQLGGGACSLTTRHASRLSPRRFITWIE